ncbi:FecR family protein [Chitinophaga rupis]|uniref:FecR family protein n=1 Tax=Chitinophaga rupis TaxID=573321 RepID=A0A1H7V721_9BACT|nr:FecR family protein [Chitinophaga rupis]SEM05046.1 FecR family protein [Chitinophaga rupis]
MDLTRAIAHIEALTAGRPVNESASGAFREWMLTQATDEELKALATAHERMLMNAEGALVYDREIAGNIFSKLQYLREEAAEDLIEQDNTPVVPLRSRLNYWWAAAAILLLILGAGTIWFLRPQKNTPALAVQPLQPGSNKALLTLANGQQIVLDNAATGQVATTGGVQVVKLDSGLIAYQGTGSIVESNLLSVPRGGQFRVTLPDGTKAWLNAASSLRYPTAFTGATRSVELTGEGYFEVAADAVHPFIVKAAGVSVQVLGTSFNIMAYADEAAIRTTVLTGAVKVQAATAAVVTPGLQASLYPQQNAFKLTHPDLEEVIAWKEGKFRFGKTNIKNIMRQMARWYDMNVTYAGNVDDVQFEGILSRKAAAAQLLEAIAATGDVHFKIEGNNVTVFPGKGE